MGEMKEKAKGLTNEGIGNTKQAVADATNDPALKQRGLNQERKGEAQQVAGEIEGQLGDDV
ncbi:MAG TPA: CsbD family protein [Novosphingobium sp.]|nr:CsbD family protein [Novosphingobium sp.]